MKKNFKDYLYLLLGLFISAISFNLFLSPYNLVSGGVSGLSIIFYHLFHINESVFMFLANLALVILSFIVLGIKATKNTLLGSFLYPIFVSFTAHITNLINISNLDLFVVAFLGGIFSGIGSGLIFKNGFSSGGTDIITLILEKKLKMPIGKALLLVEGIIVLFSGVVFGLPVMIYSLIVLYILSVVSDRTILEQNQNRVFYIRTNKPKEIKEFLIKGYNYDLTILNIIGGYSKKNEKMFMCSVSLKDYYAVKEGIKFIDKDAFITITNSFEQKNANVLIRSENYHSNNESAKKLLNPE